MQKPVRDTDNMGQQMKLAKKIKNFIYHPSDLIGTGFSSHVYRGINELETDPEAKHIAIKVIELSKIQNEVEKYLLNNEVNALKMLKHPNILQTVDILMTKNNVYIVTEFCEDGDLLNFIKKKGKLSEISALKIMKDVVEGYLCIEEKNIIHRDIKTSNIFLSKGRAKIADFGFCEFIGEKKPQLAYNVGSPAYMSPQSYKENQYSSKSDIWALGIIFYEMLTGETPDRNLTYTEMVTNLMNGNIKTIINEEIKKILCLCFKKNISQRIDCRNFFQLVKKEISNMTQPKQIRTISNIQHPPGLITSVTPGMRNSQPPQQRAALQNLSPMKVKQFKIPKGTEEKHARNNRISQPIHERSMMIEPSSHKRHHQPERQVISIKGQTQMLLFLYRLLKFISEVKLEKIKELYLILFRHRNYLDQLVEKCGIREGQEAFKEFQYLKNRFDEVYLQKKDSASQGLYREPLSRFANHSFADAEALKLYQHIIKDVAGDCVRAIDSRPEDMNLTQVTIVLDYLILEHEIMHLHLQNKPFETIILVSNIGTIVREQPKKITNAHVNLLKQKYKFFMIPTILTDRQKHSEVRNHFPLRQTIPVPLHKIL